MEDGKWGHIEAGASGKEWNGMVAQAAWGDVHFVICDMFLTFIRCCHIKSYTIYLKYLNIYLF